MKETNFCSRKCFSDFHRVTKKCVVCGDDFSRVKSQMSETPVCGLKCNRLYASVRMAEMNKELNPTRMTLETRTKLRKSKIKSDAKSYPKYFGVHEHRLVAAKKLGRPLKKGEVVHHMDHDKRNNHPENLKVFESQAEHARWHKNEIYNPEKNVTC
mgnify:FL=1